jgi:hypothetical protein
VSIPKQDDLLFGIPVWCYDLDFVERMAKLTIGGFVKIDGLKIDDDEITRQIHKAKEEFNRYSERIERFRPKMIIVSPDI